MQHKISFDKWLEYNVVNLQKIYDLYCYEAKQSLNIDESVYNTKSFYIDFAKFLYSQTSDNLKTYSKHIYIQDEQTRIR